MRDGAGAASRGRSRDPGGRGRRHRQQAADPGGFRTGRQRRAGRNMPAGGGGMSGPRQLQARRHGRDRHRHDGHRAHQRRSGADHQEQDGDELHQAGEGRRHQGGSRALHAGFAAARRLRRRRRHGLADGRPGGGHVQAYPSLRGDHPIPFRGIRAGLRPAPTGGVPLGPVAGPRNPELRQPRRRCRMSNSAEGRMRPGSRGT